MKLKEMLDKKKVIFFSGAEQYSAAGLVCF